MVCGLACVNSKVSLLGNVNVQGTVWHQAYSATTQNNETTESNIKADCQNALVVQKCFNANF